MGEFTLQELSEIISKRARSGDKKSYTRKLMEKGVERCAKKFGEEAVELALAAVLEDRQAVRAEAADVIYHFLVLLEASGVTLSEVVDELAGRRGKTGLEEKAARSPD